KVSVRNAEALSRVLQLINDDPETFLNPPNFKFTPRSITQQTDEFVALYQECLIELSRAGDPLALPGGCPA
ncbi:MAG: hypothetical protein ACREDA_08900, partial [Methylocella sp.]